MGWMVKTLLCIYLDSSGISHTLYPSRRSITRTLRDVTRWRLQICHSFSGF